MSTILKVELLQKYFDIIFCSKKKDIRLSLKDVYKKSKVPKRSNGKPYSGACIEYYKHHLGNEAEEVYLSRKVLLTPLNRLLFGLSYFEDQTILATIQTKLEALKVKYQEKFKDPSWVELWKEKLKSAVTEKKKELLSENAKNNWKTSAYREKQLSLKRQSQRSETMKNLWCSEDFRMKVKQAQQSEVRKEKIRQYSFQKWKNAKENDLELYYRMTHSSINKHYIVQQRPATSIEFRMASILDKAGYSYVFDEPITKDSKTYRPDFLLLDFNLVVECYGDYWHANPELYEESATIFRGITAKDIWIRDKERGSFYCDCGYNFVYFYQSEMKEELILNKIKEYEKSRG